MEAPKGLENNKTFIFLRSVLGDSFDELAEKLRTLPKEKVENLQKTGYLEVELSDGSVVKFDVFAGAVQVEQKGGRITFIPKCSGEEPEEKEKKKRKPKK